MKVVFLCGGIGKRMAPVTKEKFLLKFLGKTLLERQMELAIKAGLRDFVIIVNPSNMEKIKSACRNIDAKMEFAIQKEPKGMADALLSAKDMLMGEEIIIVKSSDVFDISAFEKMLHEYRSSSYDAYILGHVVKEYFPGGYLIVNEKDEIAGMVEKPGKGNEPSNVVNIVVHLHRKTNELFRYMETTERSRDDIYEFSMDRMMKDGFRFKAVRYENFWSALPYPWSVFNVMEYFLNSIDSRKVAPTAKIDRTAKIDGNVIIEDNVRVFENAVIRGPCYIGKNSVVGNNVLIFGGCHFGERCVVGCCSEIKHSYFGDDVWSHRNFIGDSIVMDGCNFGAGTITANWRFDAQPVKVSLGDEKISTGTDKFGCIIGENCKTGINVSIMPGVKVGPNSIIGAHVLVSKDIGPGKFALARQELDEKENILKMGGSKEELMKKLKETVK